MDKKTEALKLAEDVLKRVRTQDMELVQLSMIALAAIREAMAEKQAQPAQRTWVGLTEEEVDTAFGMAFYKYMTDEEDDQELATYRAIEAKLREKNQ